MKTKEELNALKEEVKKENEKLHELTEEELTEVSGGRFDVVIGPDGRPTLKFVPELGH